MFSGAQPERSRFAFRRLREINNAIDLQLVFGEIRARTIDQADLFTRFRDSRNLGNATARLGLWIQQFALGPGVALSSAGGLMLKIQRTAGGDVVFSVSGRLEADNLRELSTLLELERSGCAITLELQDLILVDVDAVGFLRACETKGIALRNCPPYIRVWMASQGDQA